MRRLIENAFAVTLAAPALALGAVLATPVAVPAALWLAGQAIDSARRAPEEIR